MKIRDKYKNNELKIRESNYEIMRILSMFFVVLYHVLVHGRILEHATGTVKVLLIILESIILVHINSFILITGYFQCKSKMKLGKVLSINNQTWFYKVIIMFILVFAGLISMPDSITTFQTIFPVDYGSYWYIGCYLILYLISPILNKVIDNSNKEELSKIILILFFIISILSTFSKDLFFNTQTGRSLGTFILLYFIGAYIRNYPINDSYFMKPFTNSSKRLIYFCLFFFCVLLSFFSWQTYSHFKSLADITRYIGSIFGYFHISYASPIIIIQSVCYFLYFGTFKITNNFINKIAKYMLGIYLISENYFLRSILYDKLNINSIEIITPKTVIYVLVISVIIFILSLFIEIIRSLLFKIIYNSKIAKKNRCWYRGKIEKLGLNVNW